MEALKLVVGTLAAMTVCLSACGRLGFDELLTTDATTVDAAIDAVLLGPFGTPAPITELAAPGVDDDATLTDDQLELYFSSDRPGGPVGTHLWHSSRTSRTAPWSTPVFAADLSSTDLDDHPGIAGDGLTIWFTSSRSPSLGNDIWTSTRPDRTSPWRTPTRVVELATLEIDGCPEPSASLLRMVLCRGPNGMQQIFETTRPSVGAPWSTPVALDTLNVDVDQSSAMLLGELEIWFSAQQVGGPGGTDLYRATRPDVGSPFGPGELVEGINGPTDDDDPWISRDGRTLVFLSGRGGDYDLWQATR